jgi:hypothetical protein
MQSALMGSAMDVRTMQGQNAAQKALHSTPTRRRGPSLQVMITGIACTDMLPGDMHMPCV